MSDLGFGDAGPAWQETKASAASRPVRPREKDAMSVVPEIGGR